MARFSAEDRETIWDMREAGVPVKRIAKHLDRQNSSLRRFIADHGGTRPTARQRSELRLSLEEREEISVDWLPASRSGRSPLVWSARRQLSAVRSTPTGPQEVPGVPGGSWCREAGSSSQAGQALPVSAVAGSGRTQARGPVVTPADRFVVG